MILLKSLYNKNIWKYLLTFIFLFTISLLLLDFYKCLELTTNKELNKEVYRTITVTFKEECDKENILNTYKEKIENLNEDNILFKSRHYLEEFIQNTSTCFLESIVPTTNIDNYISIKKVLLITFIIVIILVAFLTSIFSINITSDLEKDIALYKLVGYKTKDIMYIMFNFFLFFYLITCLSSICFTIIIFKLGNFNGLNNYLNIDNLNTLNIYNYLEVGLIIFLILAIILKRIKSMIKTNKSIELMKN